MITGWALYLALLGNDGKVYESIPSVWSTEAECRDAQRQEFGRRGYFESDCRYMTVKKSSKK